MFKDKTRSRKFWTHSSNGFIPKEILDFLFEYNSATGSLYRIRENDGRHIIPPKVMKSNCFNIYDSMNTKRRFRLKDLIRFIVNRNGRLVRDSPPAVSKSNCGFLHWAQMHKPLWS